MTAARVPGVAFLIAGHGPSAMPRSLSFLIDRWPARDTAARLGYLRIALIGGLHLTAIIRGLNGRRLVVPGVSHLAD